MSQNSLVILDGTGAAVLAAINNAMNSLATANSGGTAPTTTYAFMSWVDTSGATPILKIRNAANTGWIVIGDISLDNLGHLLASTRGAANGVAPLGADSKVPASYLSSTNYGLLYKADYTTPVFSKTGAGTATIKAGTYVFVGTSLVTFGTATAITMPTLTAGTDYAVWVKDDGTIQATTNFVSAPGAGNWRKIGGFHYAPGGHSGSPGGGNTTPQINEYSFWDLNYRPSAADPRGMATIAGGFCADIYLLNTEHITNGTSKYNVTIADGSSPPKIPTQFGGTGSNSYGSLTVWEASEVLFAYGKRLPSVNEFPALAYGTTEASSIGTDQGTTQWNAAYVSKWGCNQVAGVMWQWGMNWGGAYSTAGWSANTNGRGSTYNAPNAARFGGAWAGTSGAGSRSSDWGVAPSASYDSIGARGVCDLLILGN